MNKPIFQDIVYVKNKIKRLQEKMESLTTLALKDMEDADIDQIELTGEDEETVLGTFSRFERSYWTYSDDAKIAIKRVQALAQSKGDATERISETLRYVETKGKGE